MYARSASFSSAGSTTHSLSTASCMVDAAWNSTNAELLSSADNKNNNNNNINNNNDMSLGPSHPVPTAL